MKSILILLCGVMAMDSQSSDSISGPAVENEFLLPEEAIKDQLASGDEMALIRINSVKEMHPGTRSFSTEYQATILKSTQEKKTGWSWLGLKRKETFRHWGPAKMGEGCYVATFGKRHSDHKTPFRGPGSARQVPESRGEDVFAAHLKISDSIISRVDILPDSVLKAAAMEEIDIAVLRITYSTLAVDSASRMPVYTDYRAKALRWLVGQERESVAPLFKGEFTLKPYRIYLVAFSASLEAPQPYTAVEVFPGNMEKSIRMHQEKIRSFGKNTDAGVP